MEIRIIKLKDVDSFRKIRLELLKLNPESFASRYEEENSFSLEMFKSRLEGSNTYIFGTFKDR